MEDEGDLATGVFVTSAFLVSLIWIGLYESTHSQDRFITKGETLIIKNASYKCVKTNELLKERK